MTRLSGVLDANVAIGTAQGDVFDLLAMLYDPLYVPTAVVQEVVVQGRGFPGERELAGALGHWITEVTPAPGMLRQFSGIRSLADRQVLALAREMGVDQVLTGDERLLRHAVTFGFTCLRTSDLVVLMKRRGLVMAVKPVLDLIRQRGFGIDDRLYHGALQAAGE